MVSLIRSSRSGDPGLSGGGAQCEAKGGASALGIRYRQGGAMGLGDLLGDAQSQPEVGAVRAGALGAVETFKDVGLICFRNTGAVVRDPDINCGNIAGMRLAVFLLCNSF